MNQDYQDKDLICLCGEPFVWTSGEQKFMDSLLSKGKIQYVRQPKNCTNCRQRKRLEKLAGGNENFNSGYPK